MSSNNGPVTLLVVDDEEAIRNAVRKFLVQQGYEVATAATGEEALTLLRRQKITCMLLDVNLPGTNGIDLVPQIMDIEPSIALLMLTAVNDATSAALCMQRGAFDYLIKPIDLSHLGRSIRSALQRRHTQLESQQINQWLKEEVALRVAERRVEQANQERLSVATLEALVNALEAKDPYLRGHSARVADLSANLAAQLGCDDETIEAVRTGGRLHDIGKIGIREEILNKQGPLSDEEYEHVKQHVLVGSQILAPLVHLKEVISYVRSHHERWDGFGYPDRLAAEEIPRGARIIGAVEIYDALTTARPYQEKMLPEVAVERMRDLVGTVLDPAIHQALEAVVTQRQALVFLDESRI
ncbi:MAG: response regulator [Gemmatimonadales bacterium]|nr:response regulator [Gemmatimonadales bacterium]MDQ3426342.1 response regulator [Gemmatimonadota bacterium]